ncbi:hypothetical protein ACG9XW_07790 [Acinetobacter guillouiae]|uniref:hypothetical protein n=1 Tax=Acinetobacter guillouiae TaxID=106649 RepID=UPI003AF72702
MFEAFQLDITTGHIPFHSEAEYFQKWQSTFKESLNSINDAVNSSGQLDINKLEADWFPEIDAHIFLSHSHNDEGQVLNFANWLYATTGIKCFIDSQFWKYSINLLREIDNKYCLSQSKETYDYDKRNQTTAHIHMLLATSLMKMINKTECLFFIKPSNSNSNRSGELYTNSTWINLELLASNLLRINVPKRFATLNIRDSKHEAALDSLVLESFDPLYQVDLSHLNNLKIEDIQTLILSSEKDPFSFLNQTYLEYGKNTSAVQKHLGDKKRCDVIHG